MDRKMPIGTLLRHAAALLLASQLFCAGRTAIRSGEFPNRDSGCQLRGASAGEKLRVRLTDGRILSGRFLRVDCSKDPSLFFVSGLNPGDPWNHPDTQSVTFSAVKEIRLGESAGAKTVYAVYAVTIGVICLSIILVRALGGGRLWGPS